MIYEFDYMKPRSIYMEDPQLYNSCQGEMSKRKRGRHGTQLKEMILGRVVSEDRFLIYLNQSKDS